MGRPAFNEMGPQGPWGYGPKAHRPPRRHGAGPCGPAFYEGHADRPGGFAGRGGAFFEGPHGRGGGWAGPGFEGPGDPFGPEGRGRHGRRGPGGRRGRGPRASRGDIRAAILALLVEEQMHGYQIMREINERSGGVWRPSPGSIYPTLQQLQDEGLVDSEESPRGRRLFVLTDEGRKEAETSKGDRAHGTRSARSSRPPRSGCATSSSRSARQRGRSSSPARPSRRAARRSSSRRRAAGSTASSRRTNPPPSTPRVRPRRRLTLPRDVHALSRRPPRSPAQHLTGSGGRRRAASRG